MNTKHIIRLFVCICLIVLALPAMAQKMRTFKGTVVDESGDPLIGASVKVVGASTPNYKTVATQVGFLENKGFLRRRPDRKSTRLNSSHTDSSRMPSSA